MGRDCVSEGAEGRGYPGRGANRDVVQPVDALSSERPHKKALSHRAVFEIMAKGDGRTKPEHFCPEVLKTLVKVAPSFEEIYNMQKD